MSILQCQHLDRLSAWAGHHSKSEAAGTRSAELAGGEEAEGAADDCALLRHRQPRQAPQVQPAVDGAHHGRKLCSGVLPLSVPQLSLPLLCPERMLPTHQMLWMYVHEIFYVFIIEIFCYIRSMLISLHEKIAQPEFYYSSPRRICEPTRLVVACMPGLCCLQHRWGNMRASTGIIFCVHHLFWVPAMLGASAHLAMMCAGGPGEAGGAASVATVRPGSCGRAEEPAHVPGVRGAALLRGPARVRARDGRCGAAQHRGRPPPLGRAAPAQCIQHLVPPGRPALTDQPSQHSPF